MNDRLVNTSIKILQILSSSNMGTNDLILQTSSDRSHVEATLKALTKAKVIKRIRAPEHKQKRINQLDDLGRDLSKIIIRSEQYRTDLLKFKKRYSDALSPITDNEDVILDQSVAGIGLPQSRMRLQEIKMIQKIIQFCIKNIFTILLDIYIKKSSLSNLGGLPQAILDRIILTSISGHLSLIREFSKDLDIELFHSELITPILDSLSNDRMWIDLLQNKFIGMETRELFDSFSKLMMIQSNYIITNQHDNSLKNNPINIRKYYEIIRNISENIA